jgi:hypothetical protein
VRDQIQAPSDYYLWSHDNAWIKEPRNVEWKGKRQETERTNGRTDDFLESRNCEERINGSQMLTHMDHVMIVKSTRSRSQAES